MFFAFVCTSLWLVNVLLNLKILWTNCWVSLYIPLNGSCRIPDPDAVKPNDWLVYGSIIPTESKLKQALLVLFRCEFGFLELLPVYWPRGIITSGMSMWILAN